MTSKSASIFLIQFLILVNSLDAAVNYPLKVQKHFYTSLFYIGSPPKRFELAFDLTSSVLWVYANDEQSTTAGLDGSAENMGVQIYNPSESSTSESVSEMEDTGWSNSMLLETVDLDLYRDLVTHEGQSLGRLLFGTIEYDPQLNRYVPFDGIFGLDRFLQDNMTNWSLAEMDVATSQVFTLYTPHTVELNEPNQTIKISPEDAILTIGEDEEFKNCDKNWTYRPMYDINSTHGFFDFNLSRSQFSDKRIGYPKNAVFSISTLTAYITVDTQYYQLLVERWKPKNETWRHQRYSLAVDCNLIKTGPPIEFWSGQGIKFTVPPRDYIQRYPSGRCVLKVRENMAQFRNRWVLGLPFFHNYCVQFRYDNATVGFATSRHPPSKNERSNFSFKPRN